MAKVTLKDIKSKFALLSPREQEKLIGDLYRFSNETKRFLEQRLFGANIEPYLNDLERLTYDRFESTPPKLIVAKDVNRVLTQAKKAGLDEFGMMELHFYVFEAYVVYIDMFGISDEAIENKCAMHLDKSLALLKKVELPLEDKRNKFQEAIDIVDKHNNMYRDHLYDILDDYSF
ncbi:hypothetical protein [Hydrogenimonas thermophila]|uniref:Uncharacterized protein n=1 Tax=Hydrogenimonas thermophila TaxID=223786 RepID=A0A1I5SSQ3_9BACT|nr:hypothetical protein [Hydrogenimonas thermophila]WOE70253.1 hypothetical protein RZR91_01475 [Hydrogenimonas thermophila]WOE72770.1 hypothetical protein RZR97_01465 [Hydrogenimonas thermophila]SFP73834.1 hypothetical protein SAMN05216234_1375 [Hydrogenimonas thermophila]